MNETQARELLEEDHGSLGDLFGRLRAALRGSDTRGAFELLDAAWARLAVHVRAEHLCLFPAVLGAPAELFGRCTGAPSRDEAREIVAGLRHDHDFFMRELASAIGTLRELLSGTEGGAEPRGLESARRSVEAVISRLEEHDRLEEEHVYRWPDVLLDADGRARLAADVRRELENLPRRFERGARSP